MIKNLHSYPGTRIGIVEAARSLSGSFCATHGVVAPVIVEEILEEILRFAQNDTSRSPCRHLRSRRQSQTDILSSTATPAVSTVEGKNLQRGDACIEPSRNEKRQPKIASPPLSR